MTKRANLLFLLLAGSGAVLGSLLWQSEGMLIWITGAAPWCG